MLFRNSGSLEWKLFSFVWSSYGCPIFAAMLGPMRFSSQGLLRIMKNLRMRRYVTEIPNLDEINRQNYRQTPLIRSTNWRLQHICYWSDLLLVIHFHCFENKGWWQWQNVICGGWPVFTRGSFWRFWMRCNATPDADKLLIVATSETCPRRIHVVRRRFGNVRICNQGRQIKTTFNLFVKSWNNLYGSYITQAIRSCGTESVSSERNSCLFISSTMAVVSCASKLLLGRVQRLSRVTSSFKYATASTGKYANSNSEVKGRSKVALAHTMKTRRGVKV